MKLYLILPCDIISLPMKKGDYSCEVLEVRHIENSYFMLHLEIETSISDGRAASLELIPGQFVMFKTAPDGVFDPFLRRPMSPMAVKERRLALFFNVVGRGTAMMASLKPGDVRRIMLPLGNGFEDGPCSDRKVTPVIVAGGCGLPPCYMLATFFRQKGIPARMIAGMKTKTDLVLEKAEKALRDWEFIDSSVLFSPEISTVITSEQDMGSGGQTVLDPLPAVLKEISRARVFSCGPAPMLEALEKLLEPRGIERQFLFETMMACGVGACRACAIPLKTGGYLPLCREGPVLDPSVVDFTALLAKGEERCPDEQSGTRYQTQTGNSEKKEWSSRKRR